MTDRIEQKILQHRAFLQRQDTASPLFGCVHGWENLSRYTSDTESFFPAGVVHLEDICCDRFLQMYQTYAASLDDSDDLLRTLEPLAFFPWTEAAVGCAIKYTGKNFWSSPLTNKASPEVLGKMMDRLRRELPLMKESISRQRALSKQQSPQTSLAWLAKYGDFIDFLVDNFAGQYPIGQTILRGPLDMAAAVFGDENLLYLFFDRPSLVKEFLALAADIFMSFIDWQKSRLPSFAGGYVVGTYYIWTPGQSIRLQEDAMAMLSPELYHEFVHPHDCTIASAADWTLFHLHAAGLHLLDVVLRNEGVKIVQVSKDEGVELGTILPHLHKIQQAGKCLLLKGRLNRDELQIIKKSLDPAGLCVQAVVLNKREAEEIVSAFSGP